MRRLSKPNSRRTLRLEHLDHSSDVLDACRLSPVGGAGRLPEVLVQVANRSLARSGPEHQLHHVIVEIADSACIGNGLGHRWAALAHQSGLPVFYE